MVPVDTMALRGAVGCWVVESGMNFEFEASFVLGFAVTSMS
jgi:hypothetical protein